MIVLFTHDKRIEVPKSNPLYDELTEFDGKFLGVSLVEEEVVEEVPVVIKETVPVTIDKDAYMETLSSMFDKKSVSHKLLHSHAVYLLGSSDTSFILKSSKDSAFKVIEDKNGTLIVPERFVTSEANRD